ncbi:type II secretion system protein [Anatilimnocola sp. NA78]|uniref:type II secretion system protein n=1 Tax=Anatilimnocola sp. NA78 TaxID=3415683 RepID=UPI003CE46837
MVTRRRSAPRAFTLVEMLVVLGIIAVLIGLLLPAIQIAVNSARRATIALEISQIDAALNTYKQQRGEYPPSFGENYADPARYSSVVERHLQRCYPKIGTAHKKLFYDEIETNAIDQGEALVFWLSSISTSPSTPFDTTSTRSGYYEFDARRLSNDDGDKVQEFLAKNSRDTPYMYAEFRTYSKHLTTSSAMSAMSGKYYTQPYFADNTGNTATTLKGMKDKSFQIICAGLDGEFGDVLDNSGGTYNNLKKYPSGTNLETGDLDNITNFSEGRTLGDSRP